MFHKIFILFFVSYSLAQDLDTNELFPVRNDYYPVAGVADACPPPTVIGVCSLTCMDDMDCNVKEKCCATSCGGQVCTRPVTGKEKQVKPGKCPAKPSGLWVCSNRCSHDGDCRRTYKCCKNRCGALECIKPELEENNTV